MNRILVLVMVSLMLTACGRKEVSTSTPADRPPANGAKQIDPPNPPGEAEVAEKWVGTWESKAPQETTAKMELTLSKQGEQWKAECRFSLNGNNASNTREVSVANGRISFKCDFASDSEFRFSGEMTGSEIKGVLEIFEKRQKVATGTWNVKKAKE